MTQVTSRPRRADAQRNYDRILAVARPAIAARLGADVVLEDIAREAGVGIGTLYRHFPTRDALFEAAFLDEARELRDRAEQLAGAPDPLDALVRWLWVQLDFGVRGRAMGAAVMNAKHSEGTDIHCACLGMREAGSALLAQAQAAGAVRPDVELGDVLRMTHGIALANEAAPDRPQLRRMFDLLVAGMRTPSAD